MNKKVSKLFREFNKENIIDLRGNITLSKDVNNILNSNINFSNNSESKLELDTLLIDNIKRIFKYNNGYFYDNSMSNYLNKFDNVLVINSEINDFLTYNTSELIDYEEIGDIVNLNNIKVLFVGSSYYSRFIDYKKLKDIIGDGLLIVDITNVLDLVINNYFNCSSLYIDKLLFSFNNKLFIMDNNDVINRVNYIKDKLALLEYFSECLDNNYKYDYSDLLNILRDNNINIVSNGTDNGIVRIFVNNINKTYVDLMDNGIICNKDDISIIFNLNYYYGDLNDLGLKIVTILKK